MRWRRIVDTAAFVLAVTLAIYVKYRRAGVRRAGAAPLHAVHRAVWLGTVDATDEANAIERGAQEFKEDPAKLVAVRR
jgi:hypothetical protein